MYVDAQMQALIVEEAPAKNRLANQRREMAKPAAAQHGVASFGATSSMPEVSETVIGKIR